MYLFLSEVFYGILHSGKIYGFSLVKRYRYRKLYKNFEIKRGEKRKKKKRRGKKKQNKSATNMAKIILTYIYTMFNSGKKYTKILG